MQNILYIGQYKDQLGLGESCRKFIDCLSSHPKINLAIRPIYVNSDNATPVNKEEHIEYENNNYKKYDMLIQHVWPDYMSYDNRFGKNIGIVEIETKNIKHSGWIDRLNLLDEIWVNSYYAANSLTASHVSKPIKIIPEPYKINTNPTDPFFSSSETSKIKPYIFYTIGHYTEKHNIKNIILAFLLEFNEYDNARLFIKTHSIHHKNEDLENIIKFDIQHIKNFIRKPSNSYPDIDILCGVLSEADKIRLHKSSDCYINAVRADPGCSTAIEAALYDSLVISTKHIGSSTYFNSTNAIMVDATETSVLSEYTQIKNIYTHHEYWYDPSIKHLRQCMREAYINRKVETPINKEIFTYDYINGLIL